MWSLGEDMFHPCWYQSAAQNEALWWLARCWVTIFISFVFFQSDVTKVSGRHQAEQVSTRQDQVKAAVVVEVTQERNQSFSRGSYLGLTVKTLLEGFRREWPGQQLLTRQNTFLPQQRQQDSITESTFWVKFFQ